VHPPRWTSRHRRPTELDAFRVGVAEKSRGPKARVVSPESRSVDLAASAAASSAPPPAAERQRTRFEQACSQRHHRRPAYRRQPWPSVKSATGSKQRVNGWPDGVTSRIGLAVDRRRTTGSGLWGLGRSQLATPPALSDACSENFDERFSGFPSPHEFRPDRRKLRAQF